MTLPAVCFIFISDYGNNVRRKANLSDVLIQNGLQSSETICSINNAFGTGTANVRTVQRWFKKFCKEDESPEDEEHSGWPSEVDNNHLRASSKLILLQLCEKLP